MLIRTRPSDTDAQVTEALHKTEEFGKAVQTGSWFADIAKANSEGPAAAQGGSMGCFKRGKLAKQEELPAARSDLSTLPAVARFRFRGPVSHPSLDTPPGIVRVGAGK